jgi:hypothetical protein
VLEELGDGERRDALDARQVGDAVDDVAPEAARAAGVGGEAVARRIGERRARELRPPPSRPPRTARAYRDRQPRLR